MEKEADLGIAVETRHLFFVMEFAKKKTVSIMKGMEPFSEAARHVRKDEKHHADHVGIVNMPFIFLTHDRIQNKPFNGDLITFRR